MTNASSKILFLFPAAYSLGGLAVWLGYLIPALTAKGWKVTLGLLVGRYHDAESYIQKYSTLNIYLIENPGGSREGRVSSILTAAIAIEADLLISVNVPDVFEAASRYKSRVNNRAKAIMTLHGLDADLFSDITTMQSQIDAVITTNQLTCSMVTDYSGFEANRTFYAPYGVEMTAGEKSVYTLLKKPRILYAGRLEQVQKQCCDLVELVRLMEMNQFEYELIIAGDGPDRDLLVSMLNDIVSIGVLDYMGERSHQCLLNEVLPSADIMLVTSKWETGPIIIWEAMAAGIAVVSSRYIGSGLEKALMDQENCLLFDAGDMVGACQNIQALCEPVLRNKVISGATELIVQRYSRQASVNQWNKVLNEIHKTTRARIPCSQVGRWRISGRLEQYLGHRLAHWVRKLFKRPAFASSPGDEWPHSYATPSAQELREFEAVMLGKEF